MAILFLNGTVIDGNGGTDRARRAADARRHDRGRRVDRQPGGAPKRP